MMIIKRFTLTVLLFSLLFFDCGCNKKPSKENTHLFKVINVDEIVSTPDQYKGFMGVEGTVIRIEESKGIFLLGCEDACIFMPVKFIGQAPELKSEIVVYGELIKQEDGRYIFQGKEVKTK